MRINAQTHTHAYNHTTIDTYTDVRQINLLNYNEDKVMLVPHNIMTADITDVIESLVINVMD